MDGGDIFIILLFGIFLPGMVAWAFYESEIVEPRHECLDAARQWANDTERYRLEMEFCEVKYP